MKERENIDKQYTWDAKKNKIVREEGYRLIDELLNSQQKRNTKGDQLLVALFFNCSYILVTHQILD